MQWLERRKLEIEVRPRINGTVGIGKEKISRCSWMFKEGSRLEREVERPPRCDSYKGAHRLQRGAAVGCEMGCDGGVVHATSTHHMACQECQSPEVRKFFGLR